MSLTCLVAALAVPMPMIPPGESLGPNTYVAQSRLPHGGRGVFAARDIDACEKIEEAQTVELTAAEYPRDSILQQYVFKSHNNPENTMVYMGTASIYNHGGEHENVGYRAWGPSAVAFFALKPVRAHGTRTRPSPLIVPRREIAISSQSRNGRSAPAKSCSSTTATSHRR